MYAFAFMCIGDSRTDNVEINISKLIIKVTIVTMFCEKK